MAGRPKKMPLHARQKLIAYFELTKTHREDFAKRCGTTNATVSRWTTGNAEPSIAMMRTIYEQTNGYVEPNDWIIRTEAIA